MAFDITDLKPTEQELEEERNVVSAILDTFGPAGPRACSNDCKFDVVARKHG